VNLLSTHLASPYPQFLLVIHERVVEDSAPPLSVPDL